MKRSAGALPDFRKLAVEEFLDKYERRAFRRPAPTPAKCRIMTDISIEGGRALLGGEFVETSLRIAGGEIARDRREPRPRRR